MAAKKQKKKHTGRMVLCMVLVVLAVGLFLGRNLIIDEIRGRAARVVAQELLEQQLSKSLSGTGVSAQQVLDQVEEEDLQQAAEIAEKYMEPEQVSEYIEMAREGSVSQIKAQVEEDLTAEDRQALEQLYEKYKEQIPEIVENIGQ